MRSGWLAMNGRTSSRSNASPTRCAGCAARDEPCAEEAIQLYRSSSYHGVLADWPLLSRTVGSCRTDDIGPPVRKNPVTRTAQPRSASTTYSKRRSDADAGSASAGWPDDGLLNHPDPPPAPHDPAAHPTRGPP